MSGEANPGTPGPPRTPGVPGTELVPRAAETPGVTGTAETRDAGEFPRARLGDQARKGIAAAGHGLVFLGLALSGLSCRC